MEKYRLILVPGPDSGYQGPLIGEELNLSCFAPISSDEVSNVNTFTLEEAIKELKRYYKGSNHRSDGEGLEFKITSSSCRAYIRPADHVTNLEKKNNRKIIFFPISSD